MDNYIINYALNGEKHFTRREMNYPTKEDFESKKNTVRKKLKK